MVHNLRVKFDGRVLVPQEPVDLPQDRVLTIEITDRDDAEGPLMRLLRHIEKMPAPEDGPSDGAAQHDHHLYGWPKKPTP